MKFIIRKTGSLILSILKLDPVKLAVYHLTKEIVIPPDLGNSPKIANLFPTNP